MSSKFSDLDNSLWLKSIEEFVEGPFDLDIRIHSELVAIQ
jgi:hypothetical protein